MGVRQVRSRRSVRLLRPDDVGVGHGRCRHAASIQGAGGIVSECPIRVRPARRPRVLLLTDQSRRYLHGRRTDGRRAKQWLGGQGRHGELEQRRPSRPPRLTAPLLLTWSAADMPELSQWGPCRGRSRTAPSDGWSDIFAGLTLPRPTPPWKPATRSARGADPLTPPATCADLKARPLPWRRDRGD